jgi:hypothetical protein
VLRQIVGDRGREQRHARPPCAFVLSDCPKGVVKPLARGLWALGRDLDPKVLSRHGRRLVPHLRDV